jgi:hypothetical protein
LAINSGTQLLIFNVEEGVRTGTSGLVFCISNKDLFTLLCSKPELAALVHPNVLQKVGQSQEAHLLKQVTLLPFKHDFLAKRVFMVEGTESPPPLVALFSNGQGGFISPLDNTVYCINSIISEATNSHSVFKPIDSIKVLNNQQIVLAVTFSSTSLALLH